MNENKTKKNPIYTVVKRLLGIEGLEYLKDKLEKGLTLSRFALKTLETEDGEVFVYTPDYVSRENTLQFRGGGKLSPEKSMYNDNHILIYETIPKLSGPFEREIIQHLGKRPENICLFEDIDIPPDHNFSPTLRKNNYVFMGDDVYLFLQPKHNKIDRIRRAFNSLPVSGVCSFFLTSFPPGTKPKLKKFEFMSEDLLRQFAARTEKIFTSAYDGESFVFWQRK
jgi:hypothetical protein